MNTLQFKTNIQCSGCIEKVTPYLEEKSEIIEWEVDLNHKDRVLTVKTSSDLKTDQIKDTLKKAGYTAEAI